MILTMVSKWEARRNFVGGFKSKVKNIGHIRLRCDGIHYTGFCTNLHMVFFCVHHLYKLNFRIDKLYSYKKTRHLLLH